MNNVVDIVFKRNSYIEYTNTDLLVGKKVTLEIEGKGRFDAILLSTERVDGKLIKVDYKFIGLSNPRVK